MKKIIYIMVAAMAFISSAPADDAGPTDGALAAKNDKTASKKTAYRGSVARQLMLKRRLDRIAEGRLALALNHNRSQWQSLTPDERQEYRRAVLAYQHQDPEKQRQLLEHYEKLIKMSAQRRKAYRQRAKWLEVVVNSLSDRQREDLKHMSPRDRAKFLLQRKKELIEKGELKPDGPATKPATTQPDEQKTDSDTNE